MSEACAVSEVGYVYFASAWTCKLIKIGWAKNPIKRVKFLQTGSPVELTILGVMPGTIDDEHGLHARFRKHRAHGEWFHRTYHITNFIDGLDRRDWLRLVGNAEAVRKWDDIYAQEAEHRARFKALPRAAPLEAVLEEL